MNIFSEFWLAAQDRHPHTWSRIAIFFGAPLLLGSISLFAPGSSAAHGQITTLVSIISGLLFSALILLTEIRGRVRRKEDTRARHGDRNTLNLDYAYYSNSYAIVLGISIAILSIAFAQISNTLPSVLSAVLNWLIFSLTWHFIAVFIHSLIRLRRCYEVFGKGNH